MVQLEEVEDADLKREQPGPFDEASFVEDDADFTDTGTHTYLHPSLISLQKLPNQEKSSLTLSRFFPLLCLR